MELKFTQEIKDNWLNALKSGNYIQGYRRLKTKYNENVTHYCCIGVLGNIIPDLGSNIYIFLSKGIGSVAMDKLIELNDGQCPECTNRLPNYKDDYSCVIPFIENLQIL